VGAGSSPFYVTGRAYLAGSYKGAPFSMVIVTPAVAGPFDLGVVVVRAGLYIDPNTAQVTAKSDAIPSILQGIPLDVREQGYGGLSVARVAGRAGVSRRTFYELFDDREGCFVAVFEQALERATSIATVAAAGKTSWEEQVRAGLSALLLFFGDERVLGTLLIADALGAGPYALERRAKGLVPIHAFIDKGRSQTKPGQAPQPPPLTVEGTVGAVLSVVHARLTEQDDGPLIDLLNPLMGMIVLPYLGPAAAAKELKRPVPKTKHATSAPTKSPLEGLKMRLTYRTLRVLAAITVQPGGSNREIADHAGVTDQGQISKLLARLQNLGLIHNTSPTHDTKGEPNAWHLTTSGHNIHNTLNHIQPTTTP
jgi:AcrR family transcriptional regulator/DNA-binding MarR family transcriptional regulator